MDKTDVPSAADRGSGFSAWLGHAAPKRANCELLHLREVWPTLWLSKTRWGNYAICEGSDGVACGATTVCGDLENAENYADYRTDEQSPGGRRWIADHLGL